MSALDFVLRAPCAVLSTQFEPLWLRLPNSSPLRVAPTSFLPVTRLYDIAWGKSLDSFVKLRPIARTDKGRVHQPCDYGPLPENCVVFEGFNMEGPHPRFSGLLVRREWVDAAESIREYARDPEFAMKYMFWTDRWKKDEDIWEMAEEDGVKERFSEEWVNNRKAPPLLKDVPANPFMQDSADALGGSAAAVGVCVIGQWGCGMLFISLLRVVRLH